MIVRFSILVFLFVLLPSSGSAKGSGPFRSTMLYYGVSASPGFGWRQSFDLQYELIFVPCPTGYNKFFGRNQFKGFGLSYQVGENLVEYGINGFINPFQTGITLGFGSYLRPYTYLQLNWSEIKKEETNDHFNFRTGLGLSGAFNLRSHIHFKTRAQIGYGFSKNFSAYAGGFVTEIKVGIGLGWRRLKYQHEKKDF